MATQERLSGYYIKFEALGLAGPHWEVRAKIGGGNVYNAFLPDYEPGTWATKNVGVYLFCVPGDAPIDLLRADRSVIFKDGEHWYSTKPTDECVDENGLAAEPIVDWGPVLVDTKAPTCKPAATTTYIPKGESTAFQVTVNVFEDTSGVADVWLAAVASGGAMIDDAFIAGFLPNLSAEFSIAMPNSTAGRVDATVTVTDNAGNVGTCKIVVRAK